jgi:hypothetical protein
VRKPSHALQVNAIHPNTINYQVKTPSSQGHPMWPQRSGTPMIKHRKLHGAPYLSNAKQTEALRFIPR